MNAALTTCSCTPAVKKQATGRYILPQLLAVAPQYLATRWPSGTYPSVYFGQDGVSVNTIMAAGNDMAALARIIPGGSEKPFKSYWVGEENIMLLRVHVRTALLAV